MADCPKCGAARGPDAPSCPRCGLVDASAGRAPVAPYRGPRLDGEGTGARRLAIAAVALALAGGAALALRGSSDPPPAAELVVAPPEVALAGAAPDPGGVPEDEVELEADEPEADEPEADESEADESEADESEADEPEADEPEAASPTDLPPAEPAGSGPAGEHAFVSGLPSLAGRAGDPTPCYAKPRCVVVYVAPWCPACQRASGLIRQLESRLLTRPDVGFTIVVGRDQPDRLADYARALSTRARLDPDGAFWASARVRGVPHWFAVDAGGAVEVEFGGSHRTLDAQLRALRL